MNSILDNARLMLNCLQNESITNKFETIGSGFGSIVIESTDGIIFRIAKNLETAKLYIMEVKILPIIQQYLDVEIPAPIWHTFDSTSAPTGIMGYKKIKGNVIVFNKITEENKSTIAKEVTKFIISMHQIPYQQLNLHDIPKAENDRESLVKLYQNTLTILEKELTIKEYKRMEKWWDDILSDNTFFAYKPVLCHGDLWYENILVDDNYLHIVGIIDFSNMQIGDPAIDLTPQLYLGNKFYNEVLHEYTKTFKEDEGINQRVKRYQVLREIYGLQYVIKNNIVTEFNDSILKIRSLFLCKSE